MDSQNEAASADAAQNQADHISRGAAATHSINLVEFAVLKIFIDYKVFDLIPDEGEISISELAEKIGGQKSLIERFSNFLVAQRVLSSPSPGCVAHTVTSRGYRNNSAAALFIVHMFNFFLFSAVAWPEYFEKHGLREPKQANVIPFGLAMGYPDRDVYSIMKTDTRKEELFNLFLSRIADLVSLKNIYDFAWVKSFISGTPTTTAVNPDEADHQERSLIVDIGGGKGQGLKAIFSNYPYIPRSRCVLFDRPTVIEENKRDVDEELRSVQLIEGDMFQEQPVKGALIYYISRVLNDWPDEDVVRILKHIRVACAPDSRILIVEELLLPNASSFHLMQDIFTMNAGGKRRNEAMFKELAAQAALNVSGVFTHEESKCGVVELVLI